MDADVAALRGRYRNLIPIDRRPEGTRFRAELADGSPVTVLAVDRALTAHVRDMPACLLALERAAAMRHAAVGPLLAWGYDAGVLHCAYGLSALHELAPGAQTSDEVARIGAQLARVLHEAHRHGVAHGIIATSRVEMTSGGSARLASFGLLAALIAGGADVRHASTELCDAVYVSPEQQAGEPPNARSDIYALGAALYELFTGRPPFGGRTTSFVMATVLPEEPTSGAVPTTRADRVIQALLRAIEHAPEDRWPDANAFAAALTDEADTHGETGEARSGLSGLRSKMSAIFRGAWFPAGRSRE